MQALAAIATSTSAHTALSQPFECAPGISFLASSISSRYDVVDDCVTIGSHSFSLLRVRDTNALLNEVRPEVFANDERLPYWAELWPSSIELARYCLEEGGLQDRTVLELGCGLGLAGLAAGTAGARVIFSDYESDALLFARYNSLQNLPRDVVDSKMEFRLVDWRSAVELESVDMIIAADVIYERKSYVPILNFVRRALKKNGCAVFTDPDRSTGMPFFALAEQQGFDVALSARPVQHGQKGSTILRGELRLAGQRQ